MSYYGIIDICLHFNRFRNVDLFHQGVYCIRSKVYQDISITDDNLRCTTKSNSSSASTTKQGCTEGNDEVIAAIPYLALPTVFPFESDITLPKINREYIYESSNSDRSNRGESKIDNIYYHILPWNIDNKNFSFTTESFLIRYYDEEVELNNICLFRLEIDLCKPESLKNPIYIEIDLMYSDLASLIPFLNKKNDASFNTNYLDSETRQFTNNLPTNANKKFEIAATQIYKVYHTAFGIHEYIPVVFDEYHYSICSLTLHTVLLDIRSRSSPNMYICPYSPKFRSPKKTPYLAYSSRSKSSFVKEHEAELYEPNSRIKLCPYKTKLDYNDFLQNGHLGISNDLDSTNDRVLMESNDLSSLKMFSSFCNLNNLELNSPLNLMRANYLNSRYLKILYESLIRLQNIYISFLSCGLTSTDRDFLGFSLELPNIIFPGGTEINLSTKKIVYNDKNDIKGKISMKSFHLLKGFNYDKSFYGPDDFFSLNLRIVQPPDDLLVQPNNMLQECFSDSQSSPKSMSEYITVRIPKITSRISDDDIGSSASLMTRDFQISGNQILDIWQRFINVLPCISIESEFWLKEVYKKRLSNYWKESIFGEICPYKDILVSGYKNLSEIHRLIAEKHRNSQQFKKLAPLPVVDIYSNPMETRPIIFEQRYMDINSTESARDFNNKIIFTGHEEIHLIVLVHGFQGNSCDMRTIRNIVNMIYSHIFVLLSTSNEENTEGSIRDMGCRLANEILVFIDNNISLPFLKKVSFLCHSLGGLIARSALSSLEVIWPKLYSFITFSTPHLGNIFNSSLIVDAGMWVLKKWKNSEALKQLTISDSRNIRESYLYILSEQSEYFKYFSHVCFVSSYQDQYVPFESARVEISPKAKYDEKLGDIYRDMVNNIIRHIRPNTLIRFDINFLILEKSLDNFIGRTAHIQFLENTEFMQMFFDSYDYLFQ